MIAFCFLFPRISWINTDKIRSVPISAIRGNRKSIILLSIQEFLFADVKHKCAKGLVLRLFSKCRLVACHERRIFQSCAGHLSDLRKLGTPCLFFLRYCGGAFACHAATALAFARQAAYRHPETMVVKSLSHARLL